MNRLIPDVRHRCRLGGMAAACRTEVTSNKPQLLLGDLRHHIPVARHGSAFWESQDKTGWAHVVMVANIGFR